MEGWFIMPKFSPCLWFDSEALEAAELYLDAFEEGALGTISHYVDDLHKPKGTILTVEFTIANQTFLGLNGGTEFQFTPAISFFVDCETDEQFTRVWTTLIRQGKKLMPVQEYPFSKKFGWLEDKYGVSWQINLSGKKQSIAPAFMFHDDAYKKAEEAMNFWMDTFGNAQIESYERNEDCSIKQALFSIHGQPFRVMDNAMHHEFDFSMATSFSVDCKDQQEIDYLWERLTTDGKEWPCGWMEDKYGICWQTGGVLLEKYTDTTDVKRANRVMQAMYQMKKIDLSILKEAYDGSEHH